MVWSNSINHGVDSKFFFFSFCVTDGCGWVGVYLLLRRNLQKSCIILLTFVKIKYNHSCMRVKPDWDELATVVPSSIFIGDVNCNKEVELCREHHTGVNYPTIMVYRYRDDKDELVEELYTGGLGLDEFRHFVDSILVVERCNVQVAVLELDNNEEAVAKSTSSSTSSSSCTDKEAKYIKKWYPKGYNAWKEEMYRIANMKQRTDMTYDTEKWMNDRMYILDQMIVMKQQQQKEEGDNGSYDDGEL